MPVEPRVFFLNWNQPPTKSQVRKMLNTIASRGPQARGKFAASGGLRLRRFIIGPWNLVRKQLQASSGRLANLAMRFAIRLEPGYERLAVYAEETDTPTHMARQLRGRIGLDRKSTRLNSSHSQIS